MGLQIHSGYETIGCKLKKNSSFETDQSNSKWVNQKEQMKRAPAISPHRTNGQLFVQMCNPRRIGKKRKGSVHFACNAQWVILIFKRVLSILKALLPRDVFWKETCLHKYFYFPSKINVLFCFIACYSTVVANNIWSIQLKYYSPTVTHGKTLVCHFWVL